MSFEQVAERCHLVLPASQEAKALEWLQVSTAGLLKQEEGGQTVGSWGLKGEGEVSVATAVNLRYSSSPCLVPRSVRMVVT